MFHAAERKPNALFCFLQNSEIRFLQLFLIQNSSFAAKLFIQLAIASIFFMLILICSFVKNEKFFFGF